MFGAQYEEWQLKPLNPVPSGLLQVTLVLLNTAGLMHGLLRGYRYMYNFKIGQRLKHH